MINLNCTGIQDYRLVQRQILKSIVRHLPEDSWTRSRKHYVDGCLNFTLFINLEADVLMSHGAADKNYHWRRDEEGRFLNNGEHRTDVLVPGRLLARRLIDDPRLRLDADHVHEVGWPRLDTLLAAQAELEPARGPRRFARRRRKRVLWAPTHNRVRLKHPVSSYPGLLPHVTDLERRYDFEVSVHPRNRDEKKPTHRELVEADVVIADFGTTLYEAWALGKQVVFPSWIIGEGMSEHCPGASENTIFRERLGLHPGSFEEMTEMIDSEAPAGEPFDAHMRAYLDQTARGCSGRRIADLLVALDRAKQGSAT